MWGFQKWHSNLKTAVKDLHAISGGDSKTIESKLYELQVWLTKIGKRFFSILCILVCAALIEVCNTYKTYEKENLINLIQLLYF